MSNRGLLAGVAALVLAVPAAAQERGTVEFGAFGSAATFDNALSLKTGYGGGGRVGIYLEPFLSLEFEDAEMRATRPNGLKDVNVGLLSGRLVASPFSMGRLSVLVGAGAGVSTETNFLHSYGVDALVGAKYAITPNVAFRLDGVLDFLANEDWKTYKSVRMGLSVYRRPHREVRTEVVYTPGPTTMVASQDSVSAAETRRLRDRDAALNALRDSLRNAPPGTHTVTEARILFAFDQSVLSAEAKAVLDEKVQVFRANPDMSIVIVGYTDVKGSDGYNMALGRRRAQATKEYLASRGIAADRIIIDSRGERQQIENSAPAANRRAVFRLLMDASVPK